MIFSTVEAFMRERLRARRSVSVILALVAFFPITVFAQSIRTPGFKGPGRNSHNGMSAGDPVNLSPGDWSQVAKFAESKFYRVCCSEFGTGVAISGNTIVVSDPENLPNAEGFVFVESTDGWVNATPVAVLYVPNSGTGSSPYSGGALAISGDTIVMGPYVYVKPAGGWKDMNPTATLSASDGTSLGAVVAISGDTIVEADPFANSGAGPAYVFMKPAGGWKDMPQTAELSVSEGLDYTDLGWSAAISGNTIALGSFSTSTGAVLVYREPSGGWTNMTQTAVLTGSDSPAALGSSLSMNGDEILSGALAEGKPQAAYLFVKPTSGWENTTETAKLSGADPNQYADYGEAVAIDGKVAIVGAPYFSRGRFLEEGGVYIFTEPAGGWKNMSSSTVITGADARHWASFGGALAVQGKTIVVGAPSFDLHSAYVFTTP
jgi:hypothetical protein